MMHAGEGEASSGESCRRPGVYQSLCCRDEVRLGEVEAFPLCSRCQQVTDWSWLHL